MAAGAGRRMFLTVALAGGMLAALPGCALVVNHFKETGPAVTMDWDSASSHQMVAEYSRATQRYRDWEAVPVSAADGGVLHGVLYFEDPVEDKGPDAFGTKRPPLDRYRWGWEDYVAWPYDYG